MDAATFRHQATQQVLAALAPYPELQVAQRGIQFVIASGHQAAELATTFSAYPEMWLIGGNGAELWQREAGL
ncbi:hypothetical protein WP50_14715, partial [Lactiplantibacillus plantarum]